MKSKEKLRSAPPQPPPLLQQKKNHPSSRGMGRKGQESPHHQPWLLPFLSALQLQHAFLCEDEHEVAPWGAGEQQTSGAFRYALVEQSH